MAGTTLRRGQRVYAADGTYVGRTLQCDARFIVIGRTPWKPDHWVVPAEEVGAAAEDVVLLRGPPESLHDETAEPWAPAPDPVGNANGIDLEPLRAGMAEIDDPRVGTRWRDAPPAPEGDRHALPVPSRDDAFGLERERVERLEAAVERAIAVEIEDVEIDAACAAPPGFEPAARYRDEAAPGAPPARAHVEVPAGARVAPGSATRPAPSPAALSEAGRQAASAPEVLERILRRAGFTDREAEAVAADGFDGLWRLAAGQPPPR